MSILEVNNLKKEYTSGGGNTIVAVNDVTFSVERGELFTLLGPSGCGKTTTLRCLAGFEEIDGGSIKFDGELLSDSESDYNLAPEDRGIGFIFQSYAIWPHMTASENIRFALKNQGYSKKNREERVKETLDLVGLPNMGDRYPSELSGGQQQRVAFGRAISYDPSLLLMDEPLSNLDLKLRKEMRQVILDILEKIDVTTVYVTHDQEEAFELSDNIAIFRDGKKVQEGDPRTIYNYPKSSFVANFIGEANIIETDTLISRNENLAVLSISGGDTTVTATYTDKNALEDPVVVIRPQDILIQKAENEGVSGRDPLHETNDVFGSISQGIAKEKNQFTGYVEKVIYRGGVNLITVKNENFSLVVESHEDTWSENDTVTLTIPTDRAIVTFREMV